MPYSFTPIIGFFNFTPLATLMTVDKILPFFFNNFLGILMFLLAVGSSHLCLQEVLIPMANNKKMAGSIFCDLEKPFDAVSHDILPSKLPYCGISGKAKLLFESYLQIRYQRVQITNSYLTSNTVSEWTKIKYEVPQGSFWAHCYFQYTSMTYLRP